MKTIVYIDGYNLYYGAVRETPHKWLDIFTLFETLCHAQNRETDLLQVKFFTAPIKASAATHQQQSVQAQTLYHKALTTLYPDKISIIKGLFQLSKSKAPAYQKPLDKQNKVAIWQLEEKKTDVNIALHLYSDAVRGNCEQAVLVSNDTDLAPALEMTKQHCPAITLGAILPRLKVAGNIARPTNREIEKLTDWTRHYLLAEELQAAQLPRMIPTRKKAIFKPDYW